jgi:hypothetical protein
LQHAREQALADPEIAGLRDALRRSSGGAVQSGRHYAPQQAQHQQQHHQPHAMLDAQQQGSMHGGLGAPIVSMGSGAGTGSLGRGASGLAPLPTLQQQQLASLEPMPALTGPLFERPAGYVPPPKQARASVAAGGGGGGGGVATGGGAGQKAKLKAQLEQAVPAGVNLMESDLRGYVIECAAPLMSVSFGGGAACSRRVNLMESALRGYVVEGDDPSVFESVLAMLALHVSAGASRAPC